MKNTLALPIGWKPIPLPLKILVVVMVLWAVGSAMNLPNLMTNGLPLFGTFVFGSQALMAVMFFDFLAPLGFLYALWTRKSWGPRWAAFYIGLFILNGFSALSSFKEQLGLAQILVPNAVSLVFLIVILWNRKYFIGSA